LLELLHAFVVFFLFQDASIIVLLEVAVVIFRLVQVLHALRHILLRDFLNVLQIVQ